MDVKRGALMVLDLTAFGDQVELEEGQKKLSHCET